YSAGEGLTKPELHRKKNRRHLRLPVACADRFASGIVSRCRASVTDRTREWFRGRICVHADVIAVRNHRRGPRVSALGVARDPHMQTKHAVVIGASMGGLLAA